MELAEQDNRPFYVQFETRAVENKRKSLSEGRIVYDDVDFVMVTLPGGRDVFENRYEPWIEQQESYVRRGKQSQENLEIYRKAYKLWKEGQEIPIEGTPIKGAQFLTPAQQKTILSAGIRTVEDLSKVNDEGLRRLGMGGRSLVQRAKSWLDAADSHGKVALENAELKKQVEMMNATIQSLESKLSKLLEKADNETNSSTIPGYETLNITEDDIAEKSLYRQYEEKFGKPPHHLMKEETIRKKLEE